MFYNIFFSFQLFFQSLCFLSGIITIMSFWNSFYTGRNVFCRDLLCLRSLNLQLSYFARVDINSGCFVKGLNNWLTFRKINCFNFYNTLLKRNNYTIVCFFRIIFTQINRLFFTFNNPTSH